MAACFFIRLNNLRFFAAHGMYEEERAVGNEFEVNLTMEIKAPKEKIKSIEDTVNYAEVYRIVKEIFSKRKALLETLVMEIAEELKKEFGAIKSLSIQVIKLNPPISSFQGSVSITYEKEYK